MPYTDDLQTPSRPRDVVLQGPANWTAIVFFATLGLLHLAIALPAFARLRWEGYLSLMFGVAFVVAAMVSFMVRFEIAILPTERRIRLRTGLSRLHVQRYIAFCDVHGVRLTLCHPSGRGASRIEVLCDNEDIECPATPIPRQEALCLAMLMGVRLIKVFPDGTAAPDPTDRF
jgi:hypothetical protein